MDALVTGGAGFIGSALAKALLERGTTVRVFDNLLTGDRDAVPDGAELVVGDLRDPEAVAGACRGMEVVFHEAAIRSVPRSIDDPTLTNECNVTGTLNLLRAAQGAGVRRLVYASSSSVYGDTGGRPNSEDLTPSPMSPYAVSKLAAEQYCRVWASLGLLDTVSLRYFNVFGPGQSPDSKYAAVFPAFASALLKGEAPQVHWDGEQARDFTFIDDVVDANLKAADAPSGVSGGVFNIAGGQPRTVNEVLKAISETVGAWIEPERLPKRSGDIRSTQAVISAARKQLGWMPRADWSRSVKRTVDSLR